MLHTHQARAHDKAGQPVEALKHLLLVPVRDSLSLLLWTIGLAGRGVRWRGRPMKITAPIRHPV